MKAIVSKINRDRGEVTYRLAELEDVVNFEIGMSIDIPLDEERVLAMLRGPSPDAYEWRTPVYQWSKNGEGWAARAEAEKRPGEPVQRLSALPPTERVCSVCSKTCDLGKCWWCGNA